MNGGLKERGISLRGDSARGAMREGSFTGDPEKYVKQGSEMDVCFHMGPAFGEHGGALLS
jgi:hypothetical protein